jgi:YidC/Oxa1 family membrane protein insertase
MDRRALFFVFSLTFALLAIKSTFSYFEEKDRANQPQTNKPIVQAKPGEQHAENKPFVPSATPEQAKASEQLYVLENSYQQLVFSNIGGALVELNLPFKSSTNNKSIVLPIEFDRDIEKQSPVNARFPLKPALQSDGSINKGTVGGYYPLLRRSQLASTGAFAIKIEPRFYALNIVSEYPEVASLVYTVKDFTENSITFEAEQPHRRITKTFSIPQNASDVPYCINLDIKIEGDARGLFLTSGVPDVEWISGGPAPMVQYHLVQGSTSQVEKADLPKTTIHYSLMPNWVASSNGFFGIIIDPTKGQETGFTIDKVSANQVPSRLSLIDREYQLFPESSLPGYLFSIPLKSNSQKAHFRVFSGPFAGSILNKIDTYYAQEEGGRASDYIACQTSHGWFSFISEPFAKFLFFLMKLFYKACGSWALSIVLVTIVLRVLLYPLNSWSFKSMKKMQILTPKLKAIQEKYKKEPQKAQQEIIGLYREHGVNPISGCLPLLIQMPFLIGMFDLLKSAFELRGASFIPGWIDDLAAPDVLFSWSYPIPFIGTEFHLLPFILGAIMYVQQKMGTSLPKDRNSWTDQQRQQYFMGNIMTIFLTVMFYNFPSGLNLYWISSMLLGILQQWWTTRGTKLETPITTKR